MKLIPLTQGMFAQVDDWNFEQLAKWKWQAQKSGKTYYAVRHQSAYLDPKRTVIRMHHIVIGKPPVNLVTDHKDEDGLNNQEENLHHTTRRANKNNTSIPKTSRFPGVSLAKSRDCWHCYIYSDGCRSFLGSFKEEEKAAEAYRNAVVQLDIRRKEAIKEANLIWDRYIKDLNTI